MTSRYILWWPGLDGGCYFSTVLVFLATLTNYVSLGDCNIVLCRKVLFVEIHEFH